MTTQKEIEDGIELARQSATDPLTIAEIEKIQAAWHHPDALFAASMEAYDSVKKSVPSRRNLHALFVAISGCDCLDADPFCLGKFRGYLRMMQS